VLVFRLLSFRAVILENSFTFAKEILASFVELVFLASAFEPEDLFKLYSFAALCFVVLFRISWLRFQRICYELHILFASTI